MTYCTERELIHKFELYTLEIANGINTRIGFEDIAQTIPFPVHLNDANTLEVDGINQPFERSMGRGMEELQVLGFDHMLEVMHPVSLQSLPHFVSQMVANTAQQRALPFIQHVKLPTKPDYIPILTFSTPVQLDKTEMFCLSPHPANLGTMMQKLHRVVELDKFKLRNFAQFQTLTRRERDILAALAEGLNNRQIADCFHISRATVETHRKTIKAKLDLKNFAELMRYATAFGLIRI